MRRNSIELFATCDIKIMNDIVQEGKSHG